MTREVIPADELLYKTHLVGQYYGFTPLSSLAAAARGRAKDGLRAPALDALNLDPVAETVAGFLKHLRHTDHIPSQRQPLFVWHTNIAPGRPAPKRATVQFHALGADRALADTVIIRAALALARDLFHEEPVLRVNSMGDKETRARYARELGNFFKKHAATLPEECSARAKHDALLAAELVVARECADEMPAPTEHLSDASRKRFEELLEYLEMTNTPYELARTLLSRGSIWNDTCFELVVGGRRVAWGSRYNEFTRHFSFDPPFGAVGVVFQTASEGKVVAKTKAPKLRVSFVHIGDEAKRISLHLAEEFRKARVALAQNIGIESLTEQIHLAERRGSPYLLIMGRKEAFENSAILRNRQTQEETVLPLAGLVEHLKSVG